MQRVISLKPISSSSISPQSQKRIRAERFAILLNPNLQTSPPASPSFASTEEENMSIPISDSLRQWLETKNLQGYIRIAKASPHPNVAELVQQIDIAKITNKQVHRTLNLKREGFDVVQKMNKETIRSYFGDYSPSAKAFQTMGGQDKFFHEVAKLYAGSGIHHATILWYTQEKGRFHHRHI